MRIPSQLRRFTNGEASIDVKGANVGQILEELFNAYPEIKGHLIENDGSLRNFVNIFIGGEDIRQKGGMDAQVSDGSDIRIIPSIAGGSQTNNFLSQKIASFLRILAGPPDRMIPFGRRVLISSVDLV